MTGGPAGHDVDQWEVEVAFDLQAQAQAEDEEDRECQGFRGPPPEATPAHFQGWVQAWNSSVRPRCQVAEESTFHQMWECQYNNDIEGTHAELGGRARQAWQESPCFWLRAPQIGSIQTGLMINHA